MINHYTFTQTVNICILKSSKYTSQHECTSALKDTNRNAHSSTVCNSSIWKRVFLSDAAGLGASRSLLARWRLSKALPVGGARGSLQNGKREGIASCSLLLCVWLLGWQLLIPRSCTWVTSLYCALQRSRTYFQYSLLWGRRSASLGLLFQVSEFQEFPFSLC